MGVVKEDISGLRRPTREDDGDGQGALFDLEPDWTQHWWGMPVFEMGDATPAQRITVNFACYEDAERFAQLLGVRVTRRTDSLWWPREELDNPNEWEYADDST